MEGIDTALAGDASVDRVSYRFPDADGRLSSARRSSAAADGKGAAHHRRWFGLLHLWRGEVTSCPVDTSLLPDTRSHASPGSRGPRERTKAGLEPPLARVALVATSAHRVLAAFVLAPGSKQ